MGYGGEYSGQTLEERGRLGRKFGMGRMRVEMMMMELWVRHRQLGSRRRCERSRPGGQEGRQYTLTPLKEYCELSEC
jgi:hypothetical protein